MFKNKAFMKHALPVLILGVVYMFLYSEQQTDILNVITVPMGEMFGWDSMAVSAPFTWASYVGIAVYLLSGWILVRYGVTKLLIPTLVILGLATAGFALAGANYTLCALCLFVIRVIVVPLQMSGFMLCTNWFIRYRGRALGWITIGSPCCNVFGTQLLIALINSTLGFKGTYIAFGILIIIIAIISAFTVRDTPEACGVYPDGADHRPADTEESERITLGELAKMKDTWLLTFSYGILQFVIVAVMAFYVTRMMMVGTNSAIYLVALSAGAALGIPVSYLLGWVDDKVGSIKASLILCVLYLFATVPMAIMQKDSIVLCALAAFGIACMGGGCPTMHPAVTAYVYGRKKYQDANKWIMTLQGIILAPAVSFMAYFATKGDLTPAYYILTGMVVVAFILLLCMWNTKDANLVDRDYGKK